MAHIHEDIDFTVTCFIVHGGKVLMVNHRELKMWLPPGGHIELHENPEEALHREVQEETGLQVDIVGEKPTHQSDATFLYPPAYLDIHDINDHHRHINLTYFGRTNTDKVSLANREHSEIRWFSEEELDNPAFTIKDAIRFYAKEAIKTLS